MTDYLILPFTFVLSFMACRGVIHFSRKLQWLDHPNSRSSHDSPTPTGGGIGIVLSFSLAVLVVFANTTPGFNHYLVLLFGLLVAAIGFVDDLFSLGIWSRISVQCLAIAGALAVMGVPAIQIYTVVIPPGLITVALAGFCFLWFINLFNFMDGIDGLAAAEILFISLALFALSRTNENPELAYFILLLAAAVSGFMLLNLAPARIFMGDIGSNFLGYLLGVIMLAGTVNGVTSIWTCLILAGIFIIDATLTLLYRMYRGERWFYAHRNHAYQRAADMLGSHGKVVVAATLINLVWLLPLAIAAHTIPDHGLSLTLIAWFPLGLVVWYLQRRVVAQQ